MLSDASNRREHLAPSSMETGAPAEEPSSPTTTASAGRCAGDGNGADKRNSQTRLMHWAPVERSRARVGLAHGPTSLAAECLAEGFGLGLIILFGTGAGAASSLFPRTELTQYPLAVVWALSVATAVYLTAPISGAVLNPAAGLYLALRGQRSGPSLPRLTWLRLAAYTLAQTLGAACGAALVLASFAPQLSAAEVAEGVARGSEGSAVAHGIGILGGGLSSPVGVTLVEAWATAALVLVSKCAGDAHNGHVPGSAAPALTGIAVGLIITVCGPLTGAGLNPARDWGPRLVASLTGWGADAWRGALPYTLGPLLGGAAGSAAHEFVVAPSYRRRQRTTLPTTAMGATTLVLGRHARGPMLAGVRHHARSSF